jgi:predicted phosphodiesterase
MRVALIADIHGNLVALEAVLDDLAGEQVDAIVCLGDVASTGPQPRECVARLRELGCATVMGNADAELLHGLPDPADGDEDSRRVVEIDRWCAARLGADGSAFLRGFTPTVEVDLGEGRALLAYHGSPNSFDDRIVATTPDEQLDAFFAGREAAVLAGGHTHAPFARAYRGGWLLNPGSVGLRPPHASYALLGAGDGRLEVTLRQVALPLDALRAAALAGGMPHAEWWAGFWE